MPRWGMVIDLGRCIGCGSCSLMCAGGNGTASGKGWRRVVRPEQVDEPARPRLYVPLSCMHCEQAPCANVCPTNATFRRRDGIVDVDHRLCVGCGYCIVACPYGARTVVEEEPRPWDRAGEAEPNRGADYVGVATKCNFCLPKVQDGIARGLQPGEDAAASPWCQVGCPAKAILFGDLERDDSPVARLIESNATFSLPNPGGTATSLRYHVGGLLDEEDAPLEISPPARQRVWGWPVVANLALAGAGAGMYLMAWLATVLRPDAVGGVYPVAGLLAALGFLAVMLKTRHPLRNLNLFRGLPHSWMSWEALAGMLFIVLAGATGFVPHPAVETLGAIAAGGLLLTQGFLVHGAGAVPSWRLNVVPSLFVASGLASGSGVLLLWNALQDAPSDPGFLAAAWVVLAVAFSLWLVYLARHRRAPELARARSRLFQPWPLVLSLGVAHLLPLGIITLLIMPADVSRGLQHALSLGAAWALIVGGIIQKATILLRAGYLDRIAFERFLPRIR